MEILLLIAGVVVIWGLCYIGDMKSACKQLRGENKKLINEVYKFSINPLDIPLSVSTYNDLYKPFKNISNIINENNKYMNNKVLEIEEKNKKLCTLLNNFKENLNLGLNILAKFSVDLETFIYYNSSEYLKHKPHPAIKEAYRIDDLRKITQQYLEQKKIMEYKYEYLLGIFPELESYVDDLTCLNEYKNKLNEFKGDYDEVLSWINKDEYKRLSENERNQLALDNYIKSTKKNSWEIGRDYEMFCSYCFEKIGFSCESTGIEQKLQDLGRDIIAHRGNQIYIIQCKYWSQEKVIHEKHIAQLYGTTVQYTLEHKNEIEKKGISIIPYLVTNIKLSEMAKKFAEYLGVEYRENFPIQEFPRIKCNNNRDLDGYPTKIYHLPMDQQYDRTKITEKNGDCYVYTVEEAVRKGYRRARKHIF